MSFKRAHKKQEHVWRELNLKEGMQEADLGDYTCVSTNEKIIDALQSRLHSAQQICECMHMKSKGRQDMKWCMKPWSYGFFSTYANSNLQESETNEDSLVVGHEVDLKEDVSMCEIRHVVDSILDGKKEMSIVVEVENMLTFNSTLISQIGRAHV